MIYEQAILSIVPGKESAFERAFAHAPAISERADGCHGVELVRCVEDPCRYELLVMWDSVDDHTVGFRESPLFHEWRGLVGEFFAAPPVVEHFDPVRS